MPVQSMKPATLADVNNNFVVTFIAFGLIRDSARQGRKPLRGYYRLRDN